MTHSYVRHDSWLCQVIERFRNHFKQFLWISAMYANFSIYADLSSFRGCRQFIWISALSRRASAVPEFEIHCCDINTCIHVHTYKYTYVYTYTYTYTCTYIHTYTYIYVHKYTRIHVHICTYTHIYIYIYISSLWCHGGAGWLRFPKITIFSRFVFTLQIQNCWIWEYTVAECENRRGMEVSLQEIRSGFEFVPGLFGIVWREGICTVRGHAPYKF